MGCHEKRPQAKLCQDKGKRSFGAYDVRKCKEFRELAELNNHPDSKAPRNVFQNESNVAELVTAPAPAGDERFR